MGKKRVVKQGGTEDGAQARSAAKAPKRKLSEGVLHIQSTYNNTRLLLTDKEGNALAWSSSGSLGFKGAKKGTTFAAGKVGELIADKAMAMGIKDVSVVIRGVGSGRESSLRAFSAKGLGFTSIEDSTPVPFNGPKPRKPRRV